MDWIFDKASCVNFVTYALVQGEIVEEDLRRALACLQNRHPMLNVSIVRHGWWGARLQYRQRPGIPLKIIASEDGQALIPVIEAECMERFTGKGPLARCVLCRHSPSQSTLMLTMDHAIADGMSGILAMRDLLRALEQGDEAGSRLVPLEHAKPVEGYFPRDMLGWRGWLKHVAFLARTLRNDLTAKNVVPCTPDAYAPYDECRVCLVTREVAPHKLERLANYAKRNGITMNSLLLSAKVLATAQHQGITTPSTFAVGYDVNMRKRVTPPVGDHIGMFLSAIMSTHTAHGGSDLIALAQDIQNAKEAAMRNGELFIGYPKFIQVLNALLFLFGTGQLGVKVYTGIYKSFPLNAAVSNLGNLDIETRYGKYSIEKAGFSVSSSVWGLINLFVSTLNGLMTLNFTCLEPLVSRAHLNAFADKIMEILERAAYSTPSLEQ
ncbi:MAG TPA: condensation domain-containing protein [Deltaproteobacteria bacterium]|nr:condensation domain-containing protein [Deltaproteobacteria bacterium]HQI80961.1 condensation domain-containing protein [Deltaproteobacteria bacterium]